MKISFAFTGLCAALLLGGSVSAVMAADATTAPHFDVIPKSPVPTGTVATWPMDAQVPPGWLSCDGQAVPANYPELRKLMAHVPDYNHRQFLRGSTSGAGRTETDSTREHTHEQPAHSHGFALALSDRTVSGTAKGQKYYDMKSGLGVLGGNTVLGSGEFTRHVENIFGAGVNGNDVRIHAASKNFGQVTASDVLGLTVPGQYASGSMSGWSSDGGHVSVSGGVTVSSSRVQVNDFNTKWIIDGGSDYAADSALVNTRVNDGTVSGLIYESGGDTTYGNDDNRGVSGGAETAPMHTLVKFIIKAD